MASPNNSQASNIFELKTIKSLNANLAASAQQAVRDKALDKLIEHLITKEMWFEEQHKDTAAKDSVSQGNNI